MTTIRFTPSPKSNFQFQPTLDGTVYNCLIKWNLFGQRYYLNIYTLQRVLVVCLPLIGSPNDYDISLTAGYFTTPIVYRASTNQIEVGS